MAVAGPRPHPYHQGRQKRPSFVIPATQAVPCYFRHPWPLQPPAVLCPAEPQGPALLRRPRSQCPHQPPPHWLPTLLDAVGPAASTTRPQPSARPQSLGFQSCWKILNSNSPLDTLRDISQNFPKRAGGSTRTSPHHPTPPPAGPTLPKSESQNQHFGLKPEFCYHYVLRPPLDKTVHIFL